MTRDAHLVYISTSAVRAADPVAAIDRLLPLSRNIELTGGGSYDDQLLPRLVACQRATGVNLLLHNYFPPPAEDFVLNFADPGEQTRTFISRAMTCVQALGIPYYSVHAGFRGDVVADDHGLLHKQSDRVFSVSGIAENVAWFRSNWPGVLLALENVYPNNGDTNCAFMMSSAEIGAVLDAIPDIDLLFDLGHLKVSANLMGFSFMAAARELFTRYQARIKEIHLSENRGIMDDHEPIPADSHQLLLIREWAPVIKARRIRITLETRQTTMGSVEESFNLVLAALNQ